MWEVQTFDDNGNPDKVTICIYGDTGDGKSTQLGEFAEHRFVQTGKIMRVYTADPGGWLSLTPHVKLGIVQIVPLANTPRPWEWISHIVKGALPVTNSAGAAWKVDLEANAQIDTYAFEGMTAFGDVLMQDAAKQAADGRHIGGQPPAFRYNEGNVKWAGNAPAHYGSVQTVLTSAIQDSLRLPGNVIWTAMAKRANDADLNSTILGPQVAGKALTSDIPRWFNYTMRLMAVPGDDLTGQKSEHRLYFDDHLEKFTSGAKGLGNLRIPLAAVADAPAYISPASVVEAIKLWDSLAKKAEETMRARIAAQRPLPGVDTTGGNAA